MAAVTTIQNCIKYQRKEAVPKQVAQWQQMQWNTSEGNEHEISPRPNGPMQDRVLAQV